MSKQWYLSKTLWIQVLGAVALAVPASRAFIMEYFSEAGYGWVLINIVLRFLTKGALEVKSNNPSLK